MMSDAGRARRSRSRDRGWRIVVDRGASWLRSPDGDAWYACGVNGVNAGYRPRAIGGRAAYDLWRLYPSVDAWAATTRNRLRAWGFNHVGAWAFREDKLEIGRASCRERV